jgi:hypothetical protein
MFVKPPGPRHTSTEGAGEITLLIPARRNFLIVGVLTLWLCGWLFGEIMTPIAFFSSAHKDPGGAAFLLIWLCGWTIGGVFAFYVWLWQVKGVEVIRVSPTALSIKRDIFGYGRTRYYDVLEVRRLRVAPFTFNPFDFRSGLAFWGIGGGILAFDYGFKTFRFGAGVDEAEANIILQKITNRLPSLSTATIA